MSPKTRSMTRAEEKAVPPTTFNRFPLLPAEIRDIIWDMAIFDAAPTILPQVMSLVMPAEEHTFTPDVPRKLLVDNGASTIMKSCYAAAKRVLWHKYRAIRPSSWTPENYDHRDYFYITQSVLDEFNVNAYDDSAEVYTIGDPLNGKYWYWAHGTNWIIDLHVYDRGEKMIGEHTSWPVEFVEYLERY